MKRQIFISYSHRNETERKLFQSFLDPFVERGEFGIFSVFSDIQPSDDWHEKIQQALQHCQVGVLLISQEFLTSGYIREHELPHFLQAREAGRVELTCLYLSPSTEKDLDFPVPERDYRVKLSKYQGLNQPDRPLSGLDEHQRREVLALAASRLRDLVVTRSPTILAPPEGRRSLRIRLNRVGGQLLREYYTDYHGKITEHRAPWRLDQGAIGESLFEALFGEDVPGETPRGVRDTSLIASLLRTVYEVGSGPDISPERKALRVMLCTEDDELASQRWGALAWRGEPLAESGWSVEFLAADPPDRRLPDFTLDVPCPVVLIAPQPAGEAAGGGDIHLAALGERLDHLWPHYTERPRCVATWEEARAAFRQRRPRIVEVLAPVREDRDGLALLWESTDGGSDPRALADLAGLWGNSPPDLLFLNLLGPRHPGAACAGLAATVPVVLAQTGAPEAVRELRQATLAMLGEILRGSGEVEPGWLAGQLAHPRAQLWVSCQRLRVETRDDPPRAQAPHLVLDRRRQRRAALEAVNELVDERDRRLCCLIAYGDDGTMVEGFSDQLHAHLRVHARRSALISTLNLRLPEAQNFDEDELEAQIRRDLVVDPREDLCEALGRHRVQASGRLQPVLLLNWQLRGVGRGHKVGQQGLRAWMSFCAQRLARSCSPGLRILSCLSLTGAAAHYRAVAGLVDGIRAEEVFRHRSFRIECLDRLDAVTANDLSDFLDSGHASCPTDLIARLPELILRRTGGRFADTVRLIEQAQARTWYELHDELSQDQPAVPDAAPPSMEFPE